MKTFTITIRLEPLLYHRWVNSRALTVGKLSDRVRRLIESDSVISESDKDRLKIEKELLSTEGQIQSLYDKMSTLKMQLSAIEEKESEAKKIQDQEHQQKMDFLQRMIRDGRL